MRFFSRYPLLSLVLCSTVAAGHSVTLEKSGDPQQSAFTLSNDYPCAVEVAIDFTARTNARSEPPLPRRFVVAPGRSPVPFQVIAIDPTQPWQFKLSYRHVLGRPLADYVGSQAYRLPFATTDRYQISQAFGGHISHQDPQNRYAVDLDMPLGTPILATRSGRIIEIDDSPSQGLTLRIGHDDDSMAVYGHLAAIAETIAPGMTVTTGQLLAFSGQSGLASGPHLHFAIQVNRGMELASVPFQFLDADGRTITPQQGRWLGAPPP